MFYVFMLLEDLRLGKGLKDPDRKESLIMESVVLQEGVGKDRSLKLVAQRLIKLNSLFNGEDLHIELMEKEKGVVLSLNGSKGFWDLSKGEVRMEKDIEGSFGRVSWKSSSLFWKTNLDEVEIGEGVSYSMGRWKGKSDKMVIHLDKKVVEFSGGVEIVAEDKP